jgi:glucokinase
MLEEAESPKRYRILFGVTLGTGFGGGLVYDDQLFIGDNSNAAEIWLMRNKVRTQCFAEGGASIRAVRNNYAKNAGIDPNAAPSPKCIEDIALGKAQGDRGAAIEAYRELGEVVGDALANASTLLDGLIVIGGGLSKGHRLFMPALLGELNGWIGDCAGNSFSRIVQRAYNLEDPAQREEFLKGDARQVPIPGSDQTITYDPLKRIGIGTSVLGTSEAVGIGAYTFALHEIDKRG